MNGWALLSIILTLGLCICLIDIDTLLRQLAEQWAKCRAVSRIMIVLLVCCVVYYAGTKGSNTTYQSSSYIATLPDIGLVQSSASMLTGGISIEDAPMTTESATLTSNQMVNGYAITQVTTGSVSWLSYPESYTVLSNWFGYGVHDDVKHLSSDPQFDIYYSTNIVSDLFVASSGTLSFDAVKGTPFISTNGLPDGSVIPYAAVLHGPLSTIGPESRVWYSVSETNYCMTWENLYAGRQTNSPVSFQMEVLANQDIVYRYLLSDGCVNSQILTNFLVGLQANCPAGGESLEFTSTNATPQIFELYWTYFGYLDPAFENHDADTLLSSLEIFTYKTDPRIPDSDADGLWDDDEIAAGTNPNLRDSDGDGLPDGSDPAPLIHSTLDLDNDNLFDAWEEYWFGSTNLTDSGENDSNANGCSDYADLLMGNNPAFSAYVVATTRGENLFSCTELAAATNYSFYVVDQSGSETNVLASATNTCAITVTDCGFTNGTYCLYATADVDSTNKSHYITQPVVFEQPTQKNRKVYSITAPCALNAPSNSIQMLERSYEINRTRSFNQYYIASDVNAGPGDEPGDWDLEGINLEWSSSAGESGVTNASPANDTLCIDPGEGCETLTVSLHTTSTGLVRSQRPLYLIEWTPEVAIDTNAFIVATDDGDVMVLVSDQSGNSSDVNFSVNTEGRPSSAALTDDQISALNDPFGDSGDSFIPQTDADDLITGGSFIAGGSGVVVLSLPGGGAAAGADGGEGGAGQGNPGSAGDKDLQLFTLSPIFKYYEAEDSEDDNCACSDHYADSYPFDTLCLKKQWIYSYYTTNVCYEGGYKGVEVTLGVDAQDAAKFDVTINEEDGLIYYWQDNDTRAVATVSLGTNEVWTSEIERIDQTERCSGYWGDGPPLEITSDEGGCGCDDGCESGSCDSNDGPDLGSLKFRLSLGSTGYKRSGGFIWFKTDTMPASITPASFSITAAPGVNISSNATEVTEVNNNAVNGRRIALTSGAGEVTLTIHRYDRDLNAQLEGSWEVIGNGSSVTFIKRDSGNNITRNLTYSYNSIEKTWIEADALSGAIRTLYKNDTAEGNRDVSILTIKDSADNVHGGFQNTYGLIGDGDAAVERVVRRYEFDGNGWDTEYNYHEDNLNPCINGKLKLQNNSDGSWEYHLWDSSGRETLRVSSAEGSIAPLYLSQTADNFNFSTSANYPDLNAEVTQYSYTTHAGDDGSYLDAAKPRTVTEYRVQNGAPVLAARTWHKYQRSTTNILGITYSTITRTAIRAATQNSAINDAANRVSINTSFLDSYCGSIHLDGRPLYQQSADGSITTWEYDLDEANDELTIETRNGTLSAPNGIAGLSTYDVELIDLYYGYTKERETMLYRGIEQDASLSYEAHSYDFKGRLTSTEYSDGTSLSNTWGCCTLEESVDRTGVISQYPPETNPLHSENKVISPGLLPGADGAYPVSGSYVDLMGRTTNSYRTVHGAVYPTQTTTTEYPHYHSNLRVSTDHLGVVTTNSTSYTQVNQINYIKDETTRAGVKTTTMRAVNGETTTTTEWTDSVSGEDLKKMTKTESEIQPNGWEKRSSYVKYNDGEWFIQSETVSDLLGRTVFVETPLGTTSNFYDSTNGRLVKVSRTGMADTLYEYNELGEQTVACLDVDGDGTVDYDGLDRITVSDTTYQEISNDWWRVSVSSVYIETNSTVSITSSISRVRMTGLGVETYNGGILTAQSETEDWFGNVTRNSTYTDAGSVSSWTVTDTPDSDVAAVQRSIAGYPVQIVSATFVTNSFTYDGFARQVTAADGRSNTTFTAYNDLGQISYTEISTNRTSYFYDDLGRRTALSNALGQVSYTAYDPLGHAIAEWGTSYPVAYQFDTAGRMVALATTRSNEYANVNLTTLVSSGDTLNDCNVSALDVTQWIYDDSTGLLDEKLYADGNGTAYTYTDEGRILTRTWARGATTTYSYGALGQLTGVDYSLWTTPDVTYTHDRLGRLLAAVSTASTNTFEYTGLALTKETQNGFEIDRPQDAYGRSTGYTLTLPGESTPAASSIYDYNSYGAFGSVKSVHGSDTNTFTYGYLPGTYMVESMNADSGFKWARTYEPNRNLINSVSNHWSSSVISSFGYTNDELGRRTKRTDYFNSLSVTNDFDYNIRGEVTEALMDNGNDNYNYDYDPIGNRRWSQLNTVTNNYAANQLNQYSAISGDINAIPFYDTDGNMTWDGFGGLHLWDAENRMVTTYTNYTGITNGIVRFDYKYDHMNRRIEKTCSVKSGMTFTFPPSQGTWDVIETRKYIWDGWNIVAEHITDHVETNTTMNIYAWGLDLSGSLQGAGGVGGLLAVTEIDNGTNTYYACADANGNITEYVDDTVSVKAHYEYSVTGEEVYSSGSMDDDFTHRFSTKPYDVETGLVQYQRRPYDPIFNRWLSRDPIGIKGGFNEYGFLNNDGVNGCDYLGLKWSIDRNNHWKGTACAGEQGDTIQSLADELGLIASESINWLRDANGKGVSSIKPGVKYSFPNVWITADLMRGGDAVDRLLNLGGTAGATLNSHKPHGALEIKVKDLYQLEPTIHKYKGYIYGLVMYAHGDKGGYIYDTANHMKLIGYRTYGKKTHVMKILNALALNGYKIAEAYPMQCFSEYSGRFEIEAQDTIINGTKVTAQQLLKRYKDRYLKDSGLTAAGDIIGSRTSWAIYNVNWREKWLERAKNVNGYEGVNVLGVDL